MNDDVLVYGDEVEVNYGEGDPIGPYWQRAIVTSYDPRTGITSVIYDHEDGSGESDIDPSRIRKVM